MNSKRLKLTVTVVSITILSLAGVLGWRLWNNSSDEDTNPINTQAYSDNVVETSADMQLANGGATEIPDDWRWFESSQNPVKFAYPAEWENLQEKENPEHESSNAISRIQTIKKSDFMTQIHGGGFDLTWYFWDLDADKLAYASDEGINIEDAGSVEVYDTPIELGPSNNWSKGIPSEGRKIFRVLGNGSMHCGVRNYFFDVDEYVVHLTTSTCGSGNSLEEEEKTYFIEQPLLDIYKYIDSIPNATSESFVAEVSITISTTEHVANLTNQFPESFRRFMSKRVLKLQDEGPGGCTQFLSITRVSSVNILGGIGGYGDDPACESGAPRIWTLAPNGEWDEGTRNGTACTSANGGLVYEEFVSSCWTENQEKPQSNPNGSIYDRARN